LAGNADSCKDNFFSLFPRFFDCHLFFAFFFSGPYFPPPSPAGFSCFLTSVYPDSPLQAILLLEKEALFRCCGFFASPFLRRFFFSNEVCLLSWRKRPFFFPKARLSSNPDSPWSWRERVFLQSQEISLPAVLPFPLFFSPYPISFC